MPSRAGIVVGRWRIRDTHLHDLAAAHQKLNSDIRQHEGTLQWYCLEFWSKALDVDIASLKDEVKNKSQIRPHVGEFLQRLRVHGK